MAHYRKKYKNSENRCFFNKKRIQKMNYKGNSPTILRAQRLKERRREQQTPHQSSHEIFLLRIWEKKKRKQKRTIEKKKVQNRSRQFDRSEDFFKKIKEKISKLMQGIWSRRIRTRSTKDILLDEVIPESEYQICHKVKNLQMRIGEIWQGVIGCAEGWQNRKQGDPSGLDLINHERKIVIELKNSLNTDNSSARKHNYQK
uniref:Uncharacterized protein n=1 Tax=Klebsormidium flaccidum TaxID=3175 RepID=A0A0B5H4Y4_KLEFL|nr:hypothetical protein [Klebsormidium flaccidum]